VKTGASFLRENSFIAIILAYLFHLE